MSTEKNAKIIWDYLVVKGWSKEAIAGILGNMELESNIIPDIHEMSGGGGYGLVQWTPGTKLMYWANANNLDYRSIYTQLKRIDFEVENEEQFSHSQMTFKQFTQLKESPETMAQIFCDYYERPNVHYKKLYERQVSARKWYNKFYDLVVESIEDGANVGVNDEYYTVLSGDSLWKISQKFGITVDELVRINGFIDQNVNIYVGQRIIVKQGKSAVPTIPENLIDKDVYYTIEAGDSLWGISQKFGTTVDELVKLNAFANQNVTIHSGQKILVKKGKVISHPIPDLMIHDEKITQSYSENGQFTASKALMIKNEPNEKAVTVATLDSGERVVYDKVIITNKYVYISYISYSGVRRYLAIRTALNGILGVIWGTII